MNVIERSPCVGICTYLEGFGECLVITRRFGVKPVIDSRPGHANLVGEVLNAQDFDGVVHGVYS